jgi:hypothetical protein
MLCKEVLWRLPPYRSMSWGKNEGRHALVIAARALAPNIRTKKMSRRWIFLAGGIFDLCDWSNSWLLVASVWLMGASTDAQRRAGTYKDGSQTRCLGQRHVWPVIISISSTDQLAECWALVIGFETRGFCRQSPVPAGVEFGLS